MKKVNLIIALSISMMFGITVSTFANDSTKTKAPKTYTIIGDGDTVTAHRGDSIEVTFTAADSAKVVGKWHNPKTGKDETKMTANGKTFYLQPGYSSKIDSTTHNLTIVGVTGDDNLPDGKSTTALLFGLLVFGGVATGGTKLLKIW